LNGNSTWLEALQDDDVRKHIAYNITLVGTTKAVNAIFQNPDFAGCRTGDAAQDRKAIRSAIQVCNPRNRDRFNSQKYGAAVADAMSHLLEYLVSKSIPNLEQTQERLQKVDDQAAKTEDIDDLKQLLLQQQIHIRHQGALLSQMQWAFQFLQWRAQHADPGAVQPRLDSEDALGELPEPPESLRGNSTPAQSPE